jgi:5-(carboxyamino)imidazole ribonucleotide synthase
VSVKPSGTIGIVGGGQLARLSGLAARAMGYKVIVADPDPNCPASAVADEVIVGDLKNPFAIQPLGTLADVVTYEFENINPLALDELSGDRPVHPAPYVLKVTQDRILEKSNLKRLGIPTAPWRAITRVEDLAAAVQEIGLPAVLKTARDGYDGKGQAVLRTEEDVIEAWEMFSGRPLVLEGFVNFACELSVIVARNERGEVRPFPPAENIHEQNILAYSIVPARVPEETRAKAQELAVQIAEGLDVIGLLAVEFFCLPDGTLLVNELAPRPHNSGHWTQDACATSQFEQHIRAVCNLPLGATDLLSPVVMVNIMGEAYPLDVEGALRDPQVKLHLYGKAEARPGRKMGHMNVLGKDIEDALARAQEAKDRIRGAR